MLAEEDTGGMFATIRLGGSLNPSNTGESNTEEPDSEDENPGCDSGKPYYRGVQ